MSIRRKSFLGTIYFLYIVGKCFGISCYTISKGRTKYKVSFAMSDFLLFVAFVGALSTLIYYNLQLELNNDANNTRIFNQAQQIMIVCSLFCIMAGLVQVLLMRHRFWGIANALNGIDNQVNVSKAKF